MNEIRDEELLKSLSILKNLIDGINPIDGKNLKQDSCLLDSRVKKALIYAHGLMEERKADIIETHTMPFNGFELIVDSDGQVLTDVKLLEKMREKRMELARQEKISAFCIFYNTHLVSLATFKPKTKEEFLAIKGMGEKKWNKYGEIFLQIINCKEEIEDIEPQKPFPEGIIQPASIDIAKEAFEDDEKEISFEYDEKAPSVIQEINCDGRIYYYDGKYFFDEFYMILQGAELQKAAEIYFTTVNYEDLNKQELIEFIKKIKGSGLSYYAKRVMLYAMEKYNHDGEFLYTILPIYTSCCRDMNNPKDAIQKAEELLPKCGGSVALYTSLAAAYCDLKNYEKAKQYAKIAYARQGGGQGFKTELSLVFLRIKKETGDEFFDLDE